MLNCVIYMVPLLYKASQNSLFRKILPYATKELCTTLLHFFLSYKTVCPGLDMGTISKNFLSIVVEILFCSPTANGNGLPALSQYHVLSSIYDLDRMNNLLA